MRLNRFNKSLIGLALAGTLSTTGCSALFQEKTVEFEAVPSNATISIDGQYYGEGVASWQTAPSLPKTLHLKVEAPGAPPYEVTISNKGDYSLWWATLLWGSVGAGTMALWSQTRSHPDAGKVAAIGILSLLAAPLPLLYNHKFENTYVIDAQKRTVVENPATRSQEARKATLEALQTLPTLREVYVQIDDHYLRKVGDDRLAQGALEALLGAAGHADKLSRFAGRAGKTPFMGLIDAYRELGLSPYDRRLEYAATMGMVDALNDPLAIYRLPPGAVPGPKSASKVKPEPTAPPSGQPSPKQEERPIGETGLHFDRSSSRLVVKGVVTGSPAWRAGLKAGDEVIAIDGEPLDRIRREVAVSWLFKPEGESVALRVRRDRQQVLERNVVVMADRHPPVQVEEWGSDTLYIRLGDLADSYVNFHNELLAFADHESPLIDFGKKNLVLDLRGPDGGNFRAVEQIGGLLTTDKRFGKTVGRHGRAMTGAGVSLLPRHRKLVVLVDGTTSGGHEILAAILQDQHRAVLVGTPTYGFCYAYYGKAFADGSQLVLPTGELLTPANRRLSREAVQPNVVVAPAAFDPAQEAEDPVRVAARQLLLEDLDAWKLEEKYRLPSPEAN